MDGLLWAFCAFIFVLVIVYFLPIGFTKKGKIIVSIIGFLLAYAGTAAGSMFPLWETLLMLIVLIFFVSFILDSRIGAILYMQDEPVRQQEFYHDSFGSSLTKSTGKESVNDNEQSENEIQPVSPNQLKDMNQRSAKEENKTEEMPLLEADSDDISFLLNRSMTMAEETKKIEEEPAQKLDYLAEIEELLGKEETESDEPNKHAASKNKTAAQLDGLEEIPVLPYHEKGEDK